MPAMKLSISTHAGILGYTEPVMWILNAKTVVTKYFSLVYWIVWYFLPVILNARYFLIHKSVLLSISLTV